MIKKVLNRLVARNQFSEKSFKSLHQQLLKLHPLTDKNEEEVINVLQRITDCLVYSEQHAQGLFRWFLCRYFVNSNMQALLVRLLRSQQFKEVLLQLLQMANILVHSLSAYENKSEMYIETLIQLDFYGQIIVHNFDFFDNDISVRYISLMKGITINLPGDLLLSFLVNNNFSLFTETRSFCFYKDNMVRSASRTVMLSILHFNHPNVRDYILSSGFLLSLGIKMREILLELNKLTDKKFTSMRCNTEDDIYYINDIFQEDIPEVTNDLARSLLDNLVVPVLIRSLLTESPPISVKLAYYILIYFLKIVQVPELVNPLVRALFVNRLETKACLKDTAESEDQKLATLALMLLNSITDNPAVSDEVLKESSLARTEDINPQDFDIERIYDLEISELQARAKSFHVKLQTLCFFLDK